MKTELFLKKNKCIQLIFNDWNRSSKKRTETNMLCVRQSRTTSTGERLNVVRWKGWQAERFTGQGQTGQREVWSKHKRKEAIKDGSIRLLFQRYISTNVLTCQEGKSDFIEKG